MQLVVFYTILLNSRISDSDKKIIVQKHLFLLEHQFYVYNVCSLLFSNNICFLLLRYNISSLTSKIHSVIFNRQVSDVSKNTENTIYFFLLGHHFFISWYYSRKLSTIWRKIIIILQLMNETFTLTFCCKLSIFFLVSLWLPSYKILPCH